MDLKDNALLCSSVESTQAFQNTDSPAMKMRREKQEGEKQEKGSHGQHGSGFEHEDSALAHKSPGLCFELQNHTYTSHISTVTPPRFRVSKTSSSPQ